MQELVLDRGTDLVLLLAGHGRKSRGWVWARAWASPLPSPIRASGGSDPERILVVATKKEQAFYLFLCFDTDQKL